MKTFVCKNLDDTDLLAEKFAKLVENDGCFVCMFGDIGAGKTAFVKKVAKHLGVEEKVTSPSFVILNEYHCGKIPIFHFDLYRLENEGVKTICDELREYSYGKILTFVEWAEFSQNELPFDKIDICVTCENDDSRIFTFKPYGQENINIIKDLKNELTRV